LLGDAPFSRVDLISCRNLLIYLNNEAQKRVFDVFHFALKSGGLLFLGGAENHSQAQTMFSAVDPKHRIFVRRSTPRPAWQLPVIPLRPAEVRGRRPNGWRARPLPALTHDIADEAAQTGAVPMQAGYSRREVLFGELHLRLLEQYGPPSVVVNAEHEIVHLSENAGRYLQFVAGEPTANITRVVNPALQVELRTALFAAARKKEVARGTPTPIELIGGASETITLEVRPMNAADEAQGFFLVLFNKEAEAPLQDGAVKTAALGAISRDADD
jgi:two-component system CheB/CheR fusion protein